MVQRLGILGLCVMLATMPLLGGALADHAPAGYDEVEHASEMVPQDDGGTGADAPDSPVPAIFVENQRFTRGTVILHDEDLYAFDGQEGDRVSAWVYGVEACVRIVDDQDVPVDGFPFWKQGNQCGGSTATVGYDDSLLPADGTYYIHVTAARNAGSTPYLFSIGIGEPAPLLPSVYGG